jgi:3D (Asp-Asp-Asp) domain-containing protein
MNPNTSISVTSGGYSSVPAAVRDDQVLAKLLSSLWIEPHMLLTHSCLCDKCCDQWGKTCADGSQPRIGVVATDWRQIAAGCRVMFSVPHALCTTVPCYTTHSWETKSGALMGQRNKLFHGVAADRGGAIGQNRMDVLTDADGTAATHRAANVAGKFRAMVHVWWPGWPGDLMVKMPTGASRIFEKGPKVTALRLFLGALQRLEGIGGRPIDLDSLAGGDTRGCLAEYQRARGLKPADGVMTRATHESIMGDIGQHKWLETLVTGRGKLRPPWA